MQSKLRTVMASKKGFTLIELLVVIGILAVLAAIAIPAVAGLIDRANKSSDLTNANEMTNALERFASEYELYCQDIAQGFNPTTDECDSAQGRVYNVTAINERSDITTIEGSKLDKSTKYALDVDTMKSVVENYTKTSSSTFDPKQSDCSYFYSPACGLVVVAETDSIVADLNDLVKSGKDARGNALVDTTTEDADATVWYSLTDDSTVAEA